MRGGVAGGVAHGGANALLPAALRGAGGQRRQSQSAAQPEASGWRHHGVRRAAHCVPAAAAHRPGPTNARGRRWARRTRSLPGREWGSGWLEGSLGLLSSLASLWLPACLSVSPTTLRPCPCSPILQVCSLVVLQTVLSGPPCVRPCPCLSSPQPVPCGGGCSLPTQSCVSARMQEEVSP